MNSVYLLIFLGVDVFIIGLLTPLVYRHAQAHFKPEKHAPEKPQLPAATKEKMLHNSEAKLQQALDHSVEVLQHDLETSAGQINSLVTRFAGVIVGDEMERYRSELSKLHKQAEVDMGAIKQQISEHQSVIEAQYKEELELERQRLIKQIDTKLGDAVASFLVETLQHNIDLGNQADYLVSMLEEHKMDFIQEVASNEAKPTK